MFNLTVIDLRDDQDVKLRGASDEPLAVAPLGRPIVSPFFTTCIIFLSIVHYIVFEIIKKRIFRQYSHEIQIK